MNQFKNLIVWQKSMRLALEVYKLTDKLPAKERFGLTSQINRCVVSIASNIAEGAGRNSNKEYSHFLSISYGSSYELETQLILCKDLNYLHSEELESVFSLINEIQKMLYTRQKNLKDNPKSVSQNPITEDSLDTELNPQDPNLTPQASSLTPHASQR